MGSQFYRVLHRLKVLANLLGMVETYASALLISAGMARAAAGLASPCLSYFNSLLAVGNLRYECYSFRPAFPG